MWTNPYRPPYPNELYHHGIKGQSWGIRNGPPYPLDQEKHRKNGKTEKQQTKANKKVNNVLAKIMDMEDVISSNKASLHEKAWAYKRASKLFDKAAILTERQYKTGAISKKEYDNRIRRYHNYATAYENTSKQIYNQLPGYYI